MLDHNPGTGAERGRPGIQEQKLLDADFAGMTLEGTTELLRVVDARVT